MRHADLVRVQSSGCLAHVRALLSSLYPALRRVGEYVLERPGEVIALPIQELAERIGVSEATIVRFTQAVGYSGLRAFKLALVGERAAPAVDIFHEEVRLEDDPLTVSRKVLRSDIQAIADTLAMLETQQLEPALDALHRAQRIEVYGVGSSAPIAVDAYYRLLKIGLPVAVVTDAHMMAVSAASLTPRDVAFIVSHTGRTTETLNAAAKAAEAGATVISLSSHRQTPLDQYATIRLVTADRETAFRTEAMASRIAHLSLIDALCVNLAIRGLDSATAAMERSSTIIEERRVRPR
ncbi:MAG: MurR/RpiR family transcriptional regulator [bacterium]|nr:MurR/RpiR family transcriptional regulator [bacterium]